MILNNHYKVSPFFLKPADTLIYDKLYKSKNEIWTLIELLTIAIFCNPLKIIFIWR